MIYKDISSALPQALRKIQTGPPGKTYRTDIVTTVGYLIGIPDDSLRIGCEKGEMNPGLIETLRKDTDACIVRSLCALRISFFKHYEKIRDERKQLKTIEQMTEHLDVSLVMYLRSQGIEVAFLNVKNNYEPAIYIAYINQFLSERIDKTKRLFPDWVKFNYIRALFLSPGGYSGHRGENIDTVPKRNAVFKTINDTKNDYREHFKSYPYSSYLNWPKPFGETDGNVLKNDSKFLRFLYEANGDKFTAERYVVDVPEPTKATIYAFIDKAVKISIFVDCENVDPYSFAAMLLNLNSENLAKINKIFLYDDVNTSPAWGVISECVDIPVEYQEYRRVVDDKSLIDVVMTAGVCREFYKENTESVILASSDSDFWGLISGLRRTAEQSHEVVRFYVMNERSRTSEAIIRELDKNEIEHCFMDKFGQDKVQDFKTKVLLGSLNSRMRQFNETGSIYTLDVNKLIDDIFHECYVMGGPSQIKQEKEQFYKRFLKAGLLLKPDEADDGSLTFRMEINRNK